MTMNHLKPDLLPTIMSIPCRGLGLGLGFSVVMDPAQAVNMSSAGTIGWGVAAEPMYGLIPEKRLLAFY
jgi:hypothetical protein